MARDAVLEAAGVKILFGFQSPDYMRFYDETVLALAARGHQIELAVTKDSRTNAVRLDDYVAEGSIRQLGRLPKRKDAWSVWVRGVRGTMDFIRYLHPDYRDAPVLRARMKGKVLPRWLGMLDRVRSLPIPVVGQLLRVLALLEQVAPVCPATDSFLAKRRPDLVVVSPQIDAGSPLVDLVRAARHRGLPVVTCVASWDNLTNKGLLRVLPDRLVVWNAVQRGEAERLHGMPRDRVVMTGAQTFDRWFDRRPSRTREEFSAAAGLPADRPFVVFMGSSSFISKWGDDVAIVRRWARALRDSSDAVVAGAGILVRPHPYYFGHWRDADLDDVGAVVWPRSYGAITDEDNRRDFFDTLWHSSAVVGINTSAMIEAAILGKPVHTVRVEEFAGTQDGTLHFRYLLPENGGFLWAADSLEEHVRLLTESLDADHAERTRRFVKEFLRPAGLDQPCVPQLVRAIETTTVASRPRRSLVALVLRPLLAPMALLAKRVVERRKGRSDPAAAGPGR